MEFSHLSVESAAKSMNNVELSSDFYAIEL